MTARESPGNRQVNGSRTLGKLTLSHLPRFSGMTADREQDAARSRWAAGAQQHLEALVDAVGALRTAFEAAPTEPDPPGDPSERVLEACAALAGWLTGHKAPRGLGRAEGELGAVGGVYRNAAFAFRGLDEIGVDAQPSRVAACATMLDQGDHHVEVFRHLLAKKLKTGRAGDSA